MRQTVLAFLLCCLPLFGADFQDWQAARAVIGQPSFSAHDKGVTAVALSLSKSTLYVADASGHLLTYDVSHSGTATCPVCLTAPQATAVQPVFAGIASVALNGQKIIIADAKSHRVLLWNGNSPLELSGFTNPTAVALDNQRVFVADSAVHHVFIWNKFPTSSTQPPDVTLGVSENYDSPAADTIQTPSALASDGTSLYVADTAAHRVLVFSPADADAPQLVNAATLNSGPLAPGTLVSLSGSAKSTVLLNGLPLAVTDATEDNLQVQIPYDLGSASAGSIWTKTELEDGSVSLSRPAAVRFTATSPGIFAFGVKEPRTGLVLHVVPAGLPLSPEDPAKPSELLTVWATGLGAVSTEANSDGAFEVLAPVSASLNGAPVEVVSAVLPAEATGVYEVRLRLPPQLSGNMSLVLLQNESKSNAVTFPAATH